MTPAPRRTAPRIVAFVRDAFARARRRMVLRSFLRGGRVPWSPGYDAYKRGFVAAALNDDSLLERFRRGQTLPAGYGVGVDERCVEYPWLIAHLADRSPVLLDAGSALNHDYLLAHPSLDGREIHIMTLAPEADCYWNEGISYLFHDLRDIPIRTGYYDVVVCLSTLEHVGCDNTGYTRDEAHREERSGDFVAVVRELNRVLRPGGTLFLTVPFGVHRHFGTFQQFDRTLLSRAVSEFGEASETSETFYRYTVQGWNLAEAEDCAKCEYVEWITRPSDRWPRPLPVEHDHAAAARAVACVRLTKSGSRPGRVDPRQKPPRAGPGRRVRRKNRPI